MLLQLLRTRAAFSHSTIHTHQSIHHLRTIRPVLFLASFRVFNCGQHTTKVCFFFMPFPGSLFAFSSLCSCWLFLFVYVTFHILLHNQTSNASVLFHVSLMFRTHIICMFCCHAHISFSFLIMLTTNRKRNTQVFGNISQIQWFYFEWRLQHSLAGSTVLPSVQSIRTH